MYKRHLRGAGSCRGCVGGCCTTSIIAPDVLSFRWTAQRLGLSSAEQVCRFFDAAALGRGELRYRSLPCAFLDPGENICTIYPVRSVICRTFICCDYTPDLEDLVHNVMGGALAALLEQLREEGVLPPAETSPLSAPAAAREAAGTRGTRGAPAAYENEFSRFYRRWAQAGSGGGLFLEERGQVMRVEGRNNPFIGAASYADVPLRPFCTDAQWRRLTRTCDGGERC